MVGLLLDEIGQPIPPDTPHVSEIIMALPGTKQLVLTVPLGCERFSSDMEGQRGLRRGRGMGIEQDENRISKVCDSQKPHSPSSCQVRITEYDLGRFYIHNSIREFANMIVQAYGSEQEQALLFPSRCVACRCVDFLRTQDSSLQADEVRIVDLISNPRPLTEVAATKPTPGLSAVIFPKSAFKVAKAFWQHTGEGISSRRADYCRRLYEDGVLTGRSESNSAQRSCRGPKRYHRESSANGTGGQACIQSYEPILTGNGAVKTDLERREFSLHVEERYGRNLDLSLVSKAKLSIRRRIAGSLTTDVELSKAVELSVKAEATRGSKDFSEDDVYLYPTGMSSIFNIHRILLSARGSMKSVCFG